MIQICDTVSSLELMKFNSNQVTITDIFKKNALQSYFSCQMVRIVNLTHTFNSRISQSFENHVVPLLRSRLSGTPIDDKAASTTTLLKKNLNLRAWATDGTRYLVPGLRWIVLQKKNALLCVIFGFLEQPMK